MPTTKQKKAVANLVENGGNVSKAMRDAGYSEATAKTPQKLTESDYVQALMKEVGLTDVDGFKLLKEGMSATKTIVLGGEQDSFVDIQPDFATRHKYLETFMKVRGLGKVNDVGTGGIHFHNHVEDKKQAYDD
jgi:phage terminase small subunit